MPESTKSDVQPDPPPTEQSDADKKLDRVADDAAKQAVKTQQRYDKEHNVFTK